MGWGGRHWVRVLAGLLAVAAGVFGVPDVSIAGAGAPSTLTVTNGADTGPGSYRQAILDASAVGGDAVVTFAPGLTVTLGSDVAYTGTATLTLVGNGSTLDGANEHQILAATNASGLTVADLTFRNGSDGINGDGGAIEATGTLRIERCSFEANNSAAGGAVRHSDGTATVVSSSFTTNNSSQVGGAISSGAALAITSSTFTNNSARVGGAISSGAALTVTDSRFEGNFDSAI
ncbi:MAG: hypothetical protein AAGK32_07195, partial [Actinomycetota bacterium]